MVFRFLLGYSVYSSHAVLWHAVSQWVVQLNPEKKIPANKYRFGFFSRIIDEVFVDCPADHTLPLLIISSGLKANYNGSRSDSKKILEKKEELFRGEFVIASDDNPYIFLGALSACLPMAKESQSMRMIDENLACPDSLKALLNEVGIIKVGLWAGGNDIWIEVRVRPQVSQPVLQGDAHAL